MVCVQNPHPRCSCSHAAILGGPLADACTCLPVQLGNTDEGEKAKEEKFNKQFADVVDFLKKTLNERVEKVTVSNRCVALPLPCLLCRSSYLTPPSWASCMPATHYVRLHL